MEEIWKPIKDYEGYYEISNLGRVKSLERYVKQGNFIRHVKESFKNEYIGPYGYPCVTLCKDRKSTSKCIHILLANAFIPNPENKPAVDHINTNKTDYRLENLRWVTPKENANNLLTLQHCRENTYSKESLRKRLETRKNRNTQTSPKTVFQYSKKGNFIKEYYSLLEAERNTNINHNIISKVLNDNTLSAGGYLWTSKKVDNISYIRRRQPTCKAILQFDTEGNFIKEWSSILEAATSLGLSASNITRNIKSNSKPKKYKFKYKEDV
jgi:hypothetical protein